VLAIQHIQMQTFKMEFATTQKFMWTPTVDEGLYNWALPIFSKLPRGFASGYVITKQPFPILIFCCCCSCFVLFCLTKHSQPNVVWCHTRVYRAIFFKRVTFLTRHFRQKWYNGRLAFHWIWIAVVFLGLFFFLKLTIVRRKRISGLCKPVSTVLCIPRDESLD